jgi:hypothetical protein
MAQRVYRNLVPVINAAIRRVGGRLAYYDDVPVLQQSEENSYGLVVDSYYSAAEAAEMAGLLYEPYDEPWGV